MATIVKCPICKKEVIWNQNSPYRPFCSERCKVNDLSSWASGNYIVQDFESNNTFELENTLENGEGPLSNIN